MNRFRASFFALLFILNAFAYADSLDSFCLAGFQAKTVVKKALCLLRISASFTGAANFTYPAASITVGSELNASNTLYRQVIPLSTLKAGFSITTAGWETGNYTASISGLLSCDSNYTVCNDTNISMQGSISVNVPLLKKVAAATRNAVQSTENGATNVVNGVANAAGGLINGVATVAGGLVNGVAKVANGLVTGVSSAANGLVDCVNSTANGLVQGASTAANGILDGVDSAANDLVSGANSTTNGLVDGISSAANGLANGVSSVANGLTNGVNSAANGLVNGVNSAANGLVDGVNSTANGLVDGASTAVNGLASGASTAVNGLASGATTAVNGLASGATSAVNGLANGATTAVNGLVDCVNSTANGLQTATAQKSVASTASKKVELNSVVTTVGTSSLNVKGIISNYKYASSDMYFNVQLASPSNKQFQLLSTPANLASAVVFSTSGWASGHYTILTAGPYTCTSSSNPSSCTMVTNSFNSVTRSIYIR